MPDATDVTPYARLHLYGQSGHNPLTAFVTERGGVWVFLDALGFLIKADASTTVLASGGPEKFLKEFWPEAEFEFLPFASVWKSKRVVEEVELTTLDLP